MRRVSSYLFRQIRNGRELKLPLLLSRHARQRHAELPNENEAAESGRLDSKEKAYVECSVDNTLASTRCFLGSMRSYTCRGTMSIRFP